MDGTMRQSRLRTHVSIRRTLPALGAVLALVAVPAIQAEAEERAPLPIDDSTVSYTRHFPPIAAFDPSGNVSYSGCAPQGPSEEVESPCVEQYSYNACENGKSATSGSAQDYYVFHRVKIKRSAEFGHITGFKVNWPSTPDDPNVLLVQLWKPPHALNSSPELIAQGGSDSGESAMAIDDMENSEFRLCIANRKFPNHGYSITVAVKKTEIPKFDIPIETPRHPGGSRPVAQSDSDFDFDELFGTNTNTSGPQVTPETVALPGVDGPASTENLSFVARQAAKLTGDGAGFRLAFTLVTILIVIAGSAIVFMRIRRDRI